MPMAVAVAAAVAATAVAAVVLAAFREVSLDRSEIEKLLKIL
jgi:glycerol-3-phosphate O-acyltransferase